MYNAFRKSLCSYKGVGSDIHEHLYRSELVKFFSQNISANLRSESQFALTKGVGSDVYELTILTAESTYRSLSAQRLSELTV
jgi:hypothetical protein